MFPGEHAAMVPEVICGRPVAPGLMRAAVPNVDRRNMMLMARIGLLANRLLPQIARQMAISVTPG